MISMFSSGFFGSRLYAMSPAKRLLAKLSIDPEDELKYAAEHYVEDTGVNNNMTSVFNYLRKAAKQDPDIWKKMAAWISSVSPAVAVEIVTNSKDNE